MMPQGQQRRAMAIARSSFPPGIILLETLRAPTHIRQMHSTDTD
jgi:hypothetical protein